MDYLVSTNGLKPIETIEHAESIGGWTERMLEQVLLLDEERTLSLLGLSPRSLRLQTDGGSTSFGTDLLCIDENARMTLVELKKGAAGPTELAQLLAYGEHYRSPPWGELERTFAETRHMQGVRLEEARAAVVALARADISAVPKPATGSRPRYVSDRPASIETATRGRWKRGLPTRATIAPRMILAARKHDDAIRDIANELRWRGVDIRLADCDLLSADGKLVLRWNWHEVKPFKRGDDKPAYGPSYRWFDMLCDALACFSEDTNLEKIVVSNGWSEELKTWQVSASLRRHWPVRLYLDAYENRDGGKDEISLWTHVPHAWCEERNRLGWKKKFDAALRAIGAQAEGDAWYWLFEWPDHREIFTAKALEVATTLEALVDSNLRPSRS